MLETAIDDAILLKHKLWFENFYYFLLRIWNIAVIGLDYIIILLSLFYIIFIITFLHFCFYCYFIFIIILSLYRITFKN